MTDTAAQPLDLDAIRQRSDACARMAWRTPDGRAALEAMAADVPDLIAEVEHLRGETAELAQARAVADATRQMANDANARLRAQLLAALGHTDDGRTPLSGHISHLVAQRDALKAALAKTVTEETRRPARTPNAEHHA